MRYFPVLIMSSGWSGTNATAIQADVPADGTRFRIPNSGVHGGSLRVQQAKVTTTIKNGICQYILVDTNVKGFASAYTTGVMPFVLSATDAASVSNICVDLVAVSAEKGRFHCPGCAQPVIRSAGLWGVKCGSVTYSFIGPHGKYLDPYDHIKSTMKSVWGAGILKRLWRKITRSERGLVQATADKLCGFITHTIHPRIETLLAPYRAKFVNGELERQRLAPLKVSDPEAYRSGHLALAAIENESLAKARIAGLSAERIEYLSDVFNAPEVGRNAASARVTVTSNEGGKINMHMKGCGVELTGLWITPAQIEVLRQSVVNVCMQVASDDGPSVGGQTEPPYFVQGNHVGEESVIRLVCPGTAASYRFQVLGPGDAFTPLCPGDEEGGEECRVTRWGLRRKTLCTKLSHIWTYAATITGVQVDSESGADGFVYRPRLRDPTEIAGPLIGAILVGKYIASSDFSTVFFVEARDDIVIKYQSNCDGYDAKDHQLGSDFVHARMAAAAGVSPIVHFLSPPTGLLEFCGGVLQRDESVCSAPHGTNPHAKLQFKIFGGEPFGFSQGKMARCRAEGVVRYMIIERVGSCLVGEHTAAPMNPIKAIKYGIDVIELLRTVHLKAGIYHGDIHMGNVCKRLSNPHDADDPSC